jgi:peptidoglycan/LPS O-acetylase OafA/YrhL
MPINWLLLAVVVLFILALLSYVLIYSPRDRRKLGQKINKYYRWPSESTAGEEM